MPRIIHNDYESGKISIHKNCLRMILTDYDSDYETPLEKNGKPTGGSGSEELKKCSPFSSAVL